MESKLSGPTETINGMFWYRNGKLHREGGPAVECFNTIGYDYSVAMFKIFDGPQPPVDDLPAGDEKLIWAKYYYIDGKCHREDGPAVEISNGNKYYCINDLFHREDGPAIEMSNKALYYIEGKLHRKDGPAIEYFNGDEFYYIEGKLHREDGPAVDYYRGRKEYYKYNKLHRDDGPAVEDPNGNKYYFKNGECHREGGPALIEGNHAEIWLNGVKISETDEYYVPIKSAKK